MRQTLLQYPFHYRSLRHQLCAVCHSICVQHSAVTYEISSSFRFLSGCVFTQWNWFSNCASQSPLAYIRNIVMLWKLRPKLGKRGSGIVEHSKPCFTNLRRWGSYEASDIPVSHIEGIVWTHSDSWRCVWRGSLRDIKVTEIFIGS